jgi:hypothetical protein
LLFPQGVYGQNRGPQAPNGLNGASELGQALFKNLTECIPWRTRLNVEDAGCCREIISSCSQRFNEFVGERNRFGRLFTGTY